MTLIHRCKMFAYRIKNQVVPFNHKKAQKYELKANQQWSDEHFSRLYSESIDATKQLIGFSDEWFGCKEEWDRFICWTSGLTMLEIGSGAKGNIVDWWWANQRFIIDPLVTRYKEYQLKKFGKTFFQPTTVLISTPAEQFIPEFENTIDGVIVCRNTLDHCSDPIAVLENISRYATNGCYLLLWTDLYHPEGHDDGHSNITPDIDEFVEIIEALGFELEFITPKKEERNTVHFGCRARRVRVE